MLLNWASASGARKAHVDSKMLQMSGKVVTFWLLCNAELQLQRVIVQTCGICSTEVARQQLRYLQRHRCTLPGRDRVTVQARPAPEVGDVANAMGKGFKSPEPIVEIEGSAPLLIKLSNQHPHRPAEHHNGLANEAMGTKTLKPHRRRQGWITLNQAFFFADHLLLSVRCQPFEMGVEGSNSPGADIGKHQIISIELANQGAVGGTNQRLVNLIRRLQKWVKNKCLFRVTTRPNNGSPTYVYLQETVKGNT